MRGCVAVRRVAGCCVIRVKIWPIIGMQSDIIQNTLDVVVFRRRLSESAGFVRRNILVQAEEMLNTWTNIRFVTAVAAVTGAESIG